jgi:hypothetical protein
MMGHLSLSGRFGATPMYGESDGGVQAAETLTDPDMAPRSPTSPASRSSLSPRTSYFDQYQQHQQPPPQYLASSWGPQDSPGAAPQYWANINYTNYTAQTNQHLQDARQRAVATTGLPSLLEGATHVPPPHRDSIATLGPYTTDKEVWDGPEPANNEYSYYPPLHTSVSAPSPYLGPPSSYAACAPADIDTLTPVVVHHHHAASTFSDGTSTGRDNVLPGEDLVFEG